MNDTNVESFYAVFDTQPGPCSPHGYPIFAREDSIEAQWRVVDGILGNVTPLYIYEPKTWGPEEEYQLIGKHGPWHNPRSPESKP